MMVRFDLDDDGIGTITLNRPEKLNALSNELSRELAETVLRVASDRKVHQVTAIRQKPRESMGDLTRRIEARDDNRLAARRRDAQDRTESQVCK